LCFSYRLAVKFAANASRSATTHYRIVDQQHHNRTHHRNDHAPNVQTGDARRTKSVEQKTAHESAHNSERDVEPKSLALSVDNLASDEPGDQSKDDPTNDTHARATLCAKLFANSSRLPKLDLIRSMILQLTLRPADRRSSSGSMIVSGIIVHQLATLRVHTGADRGNI
jgi:hypothetical protein